jgi:hypothetical protein
LVNELSVENILFWEAVEKYEKNFAEYSLIQRQEEAKKIYDQFLKEGSMVPYCFVQD